MDLPCFDYTAQSPLLGGAKGTGKDKQGADSSGLSALVGSDGQ